MADVVVPIESGDGAELLQVARRASRRFQGLLRWQHQWMQWVDGEYRPLADEAMRAHVYAYLDATGDRVSRQRVTDVVDAIRAVAHRDDDLTPPCYLGSGEPLPRTKIALRNGILDIVSGDLSPPSADLFTLAALPIDYDAAATCPRWLDFLASLWPDDPESVSTLQEIVGYLISGATDHHKIFLLVGPPRSGKGTILRVVTALLGRRNVAAPTLGSLSDPFGLQALIGKLAALISDARLSGRADQEAIAEHLLSISGEDHVSIQRKFMPDYTAQLQARFVLATNELPRLHDSSGALASRFVPLVIDRTWYGREDLGLTDRLLAELPGILVWAMHGYRRLHARGHFEIPSAARDAMDELADLGSPIGAFVRERCVVEPGTETEIAVLYQAWREWCRDHGRDHPGTEQSFGRDLRAAVPGVGQGRPWRDGRRVRVYRGIRLTYGDLAGGAA